MVNPYASQPGTPEALGRLMYAFVALLAVGVVAILSVPFVATWALAQPGGWYSHAVHGLMSRLLGF